MFSFESFLDLPLIWYGLIATAVFLYVLLDGFDLGVGILFPFAPSESCRNRIMNSIAPFWDGNETWLVFGIGGMSVTLGSLTLKGIGLAGVLAVTLNLLLPGRPALVLRCGLFHRFLPRRLHCRWMRGALYGHPVRQAGDVAVPCLNVRGQKRKVNRFTRGDDSLYWMCRKPHTSLYILLYNGKTFIKNTDDSIYFLF